MPPQLLAPLKETFVRCEGNVVRVREVLAAEHETRIAYSTLTRWVREADLRAPRQRAGRYHFGMGEEMQFDTSPHRLALDDHPVKAQCASLVLAYSRRIFIRYFSCFTRFEAKAFLHEALGFMDGSAGRCMIDNSNVVVASGSGAEAVMAPEMVAFGQIYGFVFIAHAIGDANRSARVERPFYYVEKNFLAGRRFSSWDDLNAQARAWCEHTANQKSKRALGMSPEAAYVLEKSALLPLPAYLPPIYQAFARIVDVEGVRLPGDQSIFGTRAADREKGGGVQIPGSCDGPVPTPGGGRTSPAGGQALWATHTQGPSPAQTASGLSGPFRRRAAVVRGDGGVEPLCRRAEKAQPRAWGIALAPTAGDAPDLPPPGLFGGDRHGPAVWPVRPAPAGTPDPGARGR